MEIDIREDRIRSKYLFKENGMIMMNTAKVGQKIMGFSNHKPIAGRVSSIIPPQYPGQRTLYKVTCIEDHEGFLDGGDFIEFDQEKWTLILIEWNKIIQAKLEISKRELNMKSILTSKEVRGINKR